MSFEVKNSILVTKKKKKKKWFVFLNIEDGLFIDYTLYYNW